MKKAFQILIYASILFLVIRLIQTDVLSLPEINDYSSLIFSVVFLLAGFFLQGVTWKITLRNFNIRISYKLSIISDSLSVFMKYIPGKVMSVIGRASYISNSKSINLIVTSYASFLSQILTVWTGLIIGTAILLSGELPTLVNISSAIAVILITAVLIYPDFLIKTIKIFAGLLKQDIALESQSMLKLIGIIPYFVIMWLLWGIGFYFFSLAITQNDISGYVILAFPFATSLAIITIIAPGGIGIREGALFGCLLLMALPVSEASSIAVSSRIWFLFGELVYFIIGFALKNVLNRHEYT